MGGYSATIEMFFIKLSICHAIREARVVFRYNIFLIT